MKRTRRTRAHKAPERAQEKPLEAEDLVPAELSARKARAAVELVAQPTLAAAAKAAGVGKRTLRRWLREDGEFVSCCRHLRQEALQSMASRLLTASRAAVETLTELLGESTRPEIRCRAALGIIAAATKAEEVETLAARVQAENLETIAARAEAASGRLSSSDMTVILQLVHILAVFGVQAAPEQVIAALKAAWESLDGVARPWEGVSSDGRSRPEMTAGDGV